MKLSEEFKNEIEASWDDTSFDPQYIAIDETDGSVWIYQDEPYIPNYLDPEGATYFDVDTGGLLRVATGNYADFEEVLEYIGAASSKAGVS